MHERLRATVSLMHYTTVPTPGGLTVTGILPRCWRAQGGIVTCRQKNFGQKQTEKAGWRRARR